MRYAARRCGALAILLVAGSAGLTGCDGGEEPAGSEVTTSAPATSAQTAAGPAPEDREAAVRGWRPLPKIRGVGRVGPDALGGGVRVGGEVIIVAGRTPAQPRERLAGVAFAPDGGEGRLIPPAPIPARVYFLAVTDGERVYVWGGCCPVNRSRVVNTGAVYDPATDRWDELPRAPLRSGGHVAVWSGSEMIVWDGVRRISDRRGRSQALATNAGAAYDPRARSWRSIAEAPLSPRIAPTAVWTGSEMIVFGGIAPRDARRPDSFRDGASYDPERDSWEPIAESPVPTIPPAAESQPVAGPRAVWTGREMLLWNGRKGAAYDPGRDRWRMIAADPLGPRVGHSTVWTGREMVVWGGCCRPRPSGDGWGDGARYDPAKDRWRRLPHPPLRGRRGHAGVWTGKGMLVWGGQPGPGSADPLLDGALFKRLRPGPTAGPSTTESN